MYLPVLQRYMVLTGLEWAGIAALTTLTGLLSAFIVYRVIKPGLKKAINGYIPVVANAVQSTLGKSIEKATEGLDFGAIRGALGGGEGEENPLGAISGLLGGGSGGIGDLLKLLAQFGGKGKGGGGTTGW